MKEPLKGLPLRTYYRGIELSPDSEALLLKVMNHLQVEDPDTAIQAALEAFLQQEEREVQS
jgi:hypothetical protein